MFDCPALLNRCFGSHQLSNLDQEHCVELLSFRLFLDEKKLNAEAYLRTQFCEQFEFLWCSKSKLMGSIASGKICACWSCCIRVERIFITALILSWQPYSNLWNETPLPMLYNCTPTKTWLHGNIWCYMPVAILPSNFRLPSDIGSTISLVWG